MEMEKRIADRLEKNQRRIGFDRVVHEQSLRSGNVVLVSDRPFLHP